MGFFKYIDYNPSNCHMNVATSYITKMGTLLNSHQYSDLWQVEVVLDR